MSLTATNLPCAHRIRTEWTLLMLGTGTDLLWNLGEHIGTLQWTRDFDGTGGNGCVTVPSSSSLSVHGSPRIEFICATNKGRRTGFLLKLSTAAILETDCLPFLPANAPKPRYPTHSLDPCLRFRANTRVVCLVLPKVGSSITPIHLLSHTFAP